MNVVGNTLLSTALQTLNVQVKDRDVGPVLILGN